MGTSSPIARYSDIRSRRKLAIDNRTEWDTRALRTVFLKVINENIRYEGPLKHPVRPKVIYGRGHYSGYAYLHSGTMTIRLPRPSDRCPHCTDGNLYRAIIDGALIDGTPCEACKGTGKSIVGLTLDVYKVAHLFEHELAHCRGYAHKGMCSLNKWESATAANYRYLDGITIPLRPPKAKPPVDRKAKRAARIAARIASWEGKRKRAETALRKLRRQASYYERALAPK